MRVYLLTNLKKPLHTTIPFSLERKQIVDFLSVGKSRHTASAIVEIDITGIRDQLREAKKKLKVTASLTGYLIHCYAKAVSADKRMQAFRKGNKLVIFDDIDIATMIERTVNGEQVPVGYVIRKADTKSIFEISEELKIAKEKQSTELVDGEDALPNGTLIKLVKRIGFIRRWFIRKIFSDPFLKKRINGTIGFSSMGMFSYNTAGWIVPITPQVLTVMIGGIRKLPALEQGQIVEKETVCITIAMDHDILDGAQTARFIERFRKNISSGISDETYS